MKHLKSIALAAMATMALIALAAAPSASATTLEVGGVTQNRAVTIHATIGAGNTTQLSEPFRIAINRCSVSTIHAETERTFTTAGTAAIGGAIRTLTFERCTQDPVVVHRAGSLSVQWIRGTTNGTVFSTGTEVTWPLGMLGTVTCLTNNTDIGTLTGVRSGQATLDINGNLPCTRIGTGVWTGTYTVTTPEGSGVEE
jgi:hypothetical protein